MKKGFTLIELLIVMVVVTILVTVALPAYKTSMEKGRALEGIANAAAISDAMNAYYIRNGNDYGRSASNLREYSIGDGGSGGVAGITQNKNFTISSFSAGKDSASVGLRRTTGAYTIVFSSSKGQVVRRSCTGHTEAGRKYCKAIGL